LYCWGMPTFTDTEVYNPTGNVNVFAPSGFDMDQIIAAAVAAKAHYVGWLAKHHDGFAMWYTTTTTYGLKETSWYGTNGIDPLAQFCTKARAAGLAVVIYYSVRDATHPNGGRPSSDAAAFRAFNEAQLTELATNYGAYVAMWLDGAEWWYVGAAPWPTSDTRNNFIRGLRSGTLVVNNSHQGAATSDVIVYEGGFPLVGNTVPTEGVSAILSNGNYFWKTSGNTPLSAATVLSNISTHNSRGASHFLGIPIDASGQVPSAVVSVLTDIGNGLP
jgi:alpha-L-fucosidase